MVSIESELLADEARALLPYTPLPNQELLLQALAAYACHRRPNDVFILNGYAGTGKTSLLGALLTAMRRLKMKTVLIAPTGRAAKVASAMSEVVASTIHKRVYHLDLSEPGSMQFVAAPNHDKDTLFVADEASMITDSGQSSVLQALVRHVYSGPGCGLVLSGDVAQLPPIGQSDSPAMSGKRLEQLGLNPISFELDEPVRQAGGSGILFNATLARQALSLGRKLKALRSSGFKDVVIVPPDELGDYVADSWNRVGVEETILITRSNHRANAYNSELRKRIMMADSPLERSERLVVSKNNYYWTRKEKGMPFLANGETVRVEWFGSAEKRYGRYFVDVELAVPGKEAPLAAKLMLRSLMSEGPSLPREEMERFYNQVVAEQEGELSQRLLAAQEDPYFNAIQAKYAYCVTCHKAQGGQWRHVYIDMGGIATEAMDRDFHRWLYTAITRATEKVFLINPPLKIV